MKKPRQRPGSILALVPALAFVTRFVWPCLAAAASLYGGEVVPAYRVRHWVSTDGLPANRITCLKQTRDGYLWVGTWFGLARFDGTRFVVFNQSNAPELGNATVNALAEDETGVLWIGTKEGLANYGGGEFGRLGTTQGLPAPQVWDLSQARSGGLWLRAGGTVLKRQKGRFCSARDFKWAGDIKGLSEATDGTVDLVMDMGWFKLSAGGEVLRTNYLVRTGDSMLLAASPAPTPGTFWVGTKQGLRTLSAGGAPVQPAGSPGPEAVDFIFRDRAGSLWVNSLGGGLWRRSGGQWAAVDLEGALSARASVPNTLCAQEDAEGNLWLGTDQGLFQLARPAAQTYTRSDGLPSDEIFSVCEGGDGSIWVGTDHGLGCIRDGQVAHLPATEPEPEFGDRCVWPVGGGGVLFAKLSRGIFEYEDGHFVRDIRGRDPGTYGVLYEELSGRLWAGSGESLQSFSEQSPGVFSASGPAYPVPKVVTLLADRQGELWAGTDGHGLACLRSGGWQFFTTQDGLSDDQVWTLHESADGTLWLGTGKGLTRYKGGKFFAFGRPQGLPEPIINWILEDDAGYLWLSGLQGIHRVALSELNAVAEGRAASFASLTLGTADGMVSPETNGGSQPAGWKARDGRLWFPTGRGVVVIDPKLVPSHETAPPVVIEEVRADDKVVYGVDLKPHVGRVSQPGHPPIQRRDGPPGHSAVRIEAGRGRVLEFHYTVNTFVAPEEARFRYRLVGADADWREETSERTVRYINLRPGDYQFEVLAANHHGIWTSSPQSFTFSLAPQFWQTWSFYVLCGFGLVGLAAGIQAYRLRWQHRLLKLEEQRALANERARIARDLHDDLGTALIGLALELNVAGRETAGSGAASDRFKDTAKRMRELADRMREVVWTVNPKCDTVSSLASFLEQQVSQFLRADGIRTRLEFPEDIPSLPLGAEARHQLALNVREALSNVVRHAQATEVTLSLAVTNGALLVQVKDNGRGFQPCVTRGQGLSNMQTRMEQIGGTFECQGHPGQGTTVTLWLPLPT